METIHTCECGKRWTVRKIKTIMRDKDSAHCTCGGLIIEWNGGHTYGVTEIKDTNPVPLATHS
jgi:hypothetical protein